MHGAAYKNLPKVVQLLADKGARVEVWNRKNKYGWTPLSIAEGHRPGNFKPSPETIAALHRVLPAASSPPPEADTPAKDRNGSYADPRAEAHTLGCPASCPQFAPGDPSQMFSDQRYNDPACFRTS